MSDMNQYLTFRKMITPVAIQLIFWIGVAAIAVSALGVMFGGSFLAGVGLLVVGPVFWRIYCELMIILFRIHDRLSEIAKK